MSEGRSESESKPVVSSVSGLIFADNSEYYVSSNSNNIGNAKTKKNSECM